MIDSKIIKEKGLRAWKSYLQSIVTGVPFFPYSIRFSKPTPGEALKNFSMLDGWIKELKGKSKDFLGYGYSVDFSQINNRQIGRQRIPEKIYFETEMDYLKFIEFTKESELFKKSFKLLNSRYPILYDWVLKYPQKLIDNCYILDDLLKVLDFFVLNPKPGIYVREIAAGVHSKFIENNKGIIRELLDIVIEKDVNISENDFEKRFNLKYPEPLVRMKILDKQISKKYFSGITDLSLTVTEFSELNIPVENVIVIENKTSFSNILNFLTLPDIKNTIALFGNGFGVNLCGRALWLNNTKIKYWGDIDTHGFIILSNFRKYFPATESVMMDEETFEMFSSLSVEGEVVSKYQDLRLSKDEFELFQRLNIKGTKNRLEQEFISNDYAVSKLCF